MEIKILQGRKAAITVEKKAILGETVLSLRRNVIILMITLRSLLAALTAEKTGI